MGRVTVRGTLGINVRRLRIRAGITQVSLATVVDVDPSYIVHIEKGERNVSIDVIVKLAKALNVKPVTLLNT